MSQEQSSQNESTLMGRFGARFGVDPHKLFDTLKAVAFRQREGHAQPTNEQMMALMIVAEQYGLNPFLKEIYAYPDKNNGIVPVVGVDGWSNIVNAHPQYDGFEVVYSESKVEVTGVNFPVHEWIEVVIHRKDRTVPSRVREFMDECYRPPTQRNGAHGAYQINGPWQTHARRMLRHKAFIQCGRLALGFTGIFDQDEAERIIDADSNVVGASVKVVKTQDDQRTASSAENVASAQGNAPPQLTHEQLEPVLQQLLNRTLPNQTWNVAHQYVEQRFSGENLERAKTFLHDKQMEHMHAPEQDYEAMQQRRASGQVERSERVMPPLDDLVLPPGGLDSQAESSFF